MKLIILEHLKRIEKEKGIHILLACETGSRAWGFPSPDSDFDVRLIYVHKKDWYLSLSEKKDSIDLMLDNNNIDISGWELRKSLRLLRKSNASILERIQSPILYKYDELFLDEINRLAFTQYSKIATMHHYLSMAKKFFTDLKLQDKYKLKKLFYALRSATACKWIIENDEIPPIEFEKMILGVSISETLNGRIKDLIDLKSKISESYMHNGEKEIFTFIEDCILLAEDLKNSLPSSNGEIKELDLFLRKTITDNDN